MAASGSEAKHGFYNKNIRPFTNASRRRKNRQPYKAETVEGVPF